MIETWRVMEYRPDGGPKKAVEELNDLESLSDTELLILYAEGGPEQHSRLHEYMRTKRPSALARSRIMWQLGQWGPEGTFSSAEFGPNGLIVRLRPSLDCEDPPL